MDQPALDLDRMAEDDDWLNRLDLLAVPATELLHLRPGIQTSLAWDGLNVSLDSITTMFSTVEDPGAGSTCREQILLGSSHGSTTAVMGGGGPYEGPWPLQPRRTAGPSQRQRQHAQPQPEPQQQQSSLGALDSLAERQSSGSLSYMGEMYSAAPDPAHRDHYTHLTQPALALAPDSRKCLSHVTAWQVPTPGARFQPPDKLHQQGWSHQKQQQFADTYQASSQVEELHNHRGPGSPQRQSFGGTEDSKHATVTGQEGILATAFASSSPSLTSPHRSLADSPSVAAAVARPLAPQSRMRTKDRRHPPAPLPRTQPAAASAAAALWPAATAAGFSGASPRPRRAAAAAATATLRSLVSTRFAEAYEEEEEEEDEDWQQPVEAGITSEERLNFGVEEVAAAAQPPWPACASAETQPAKKKHNPWSTEETEALIEGVRLVGVGKWAEVKKLPLPLVAGTLANRSAVDLKDKWRNLSRVARLPKSALKSRLAKGGSDTPLELVLAVKELLGSRSDQRGWR